MSTTWKQVVLDTADAVREANGSTAKIPVGQLADKVRAGAGIPYEGENPLTIGSDGYTFPAKTLLKDGLQIVNGVNGEDLTDTAAEQTLAVEELLKMVSRKVAESKGEGPYVWVKKNVKKLPNEYVAVEYIESTGTQYIDTGIIPNTETQVDISFIPASANQSDHAIFGAAWTNNGFSLITHDSYFSFYAKGNEIQIPRIANALNTVSCSAETIVANGVSKTVTGSQKINSSYPIYLFWVGNLDSPNNRGCYKLVDCQIRQGGSFARYYATCKNPSTGEVGLYDFVSEQFSGNIGTGTFNAGAVSENIPCMPTDSVGYVVSNDMDAYPDGGELDGYWYELVKEGVKGVDFGEVTTSSMNTSITIQHGLGEEPNIAIICSVGVDIYNTSSSYVTAVLKTTFDLGNGSVAQYGGFIGRTNTSGNFATITDTDVTFNVGSSYRFLAGKYKWVVAKV